MREVLFDSNLGLQPFGLAGGPRDSFAFDASNYEPVTEQDAHHLLFGELALLHGSFFREGPSAANSMIRLVTVKIWTPSEEGGP